MASEMCFGMNESFKGNKLREGIGCGCAPVMELGADIMVEGSDDDGSGRGGAEGKA